MDLVSSEKALYEKVYDIPDYGSYSPAMSNYSLIVAALEEVGAKTVLDAGCGRGDVVHALNNALYDARGVDITLKGIIFYIKCLVYDEAPLSDLPYTDKQFDAAISFDVLEHIPAGLLIESVRELARVTKKGLLCQVALFKDAYGKRINETLHKSVLTDPEWQALLKSVFKKVVVLDVTALHATYWCDNG